ncbi:MAG TPA: DUF5343 domain-containing protein [Bryobacteraceae bacterium]|nr:DUF5343 domain-containing protein [Bryobacteraceae bacterium]
MATLPYITAPGNIEKALVAIKSAATPPNVSQDFVKTILGIPGGSGNQVTSFLKKIGFVNLDGTPSDLYKKFRNSGTSGMAAAEALEFGYKSLYARNEYMHKLPEEQLRGLIIEETGQGDDSSVTGLVLASIKAIKKFANWSTSAPSATPPQDTSQAAMVAQLEKPNGILERHRRGDKVGLNLSYTINLNLPATSDSAVFNAIFKSLKENLLRDHDE